MQTSRGNAVFIVCMCVCVLHSHRIVRESHRSQKSLPDKFSGTLFSIHSITDKNNPRPSMRSTEGLPSIILGFRISLIYILTKTPANGQTQL